MSVPATTARFYTDLPATLVLSDKAEETYLSFKMLDRAIREFHTNIENGGGPPTNEGDLRSTRCKEHYRTWKGRAPLPRDWNRRSGRERRFSD